MTRLKNFKLPIFMVFPAILLAQATALPATAQAFYQSTESEGTIGADIGGVWLASFHVMPSFRVRVDRVDENTVAPWKVEPVGKEHEPVLGKALNGVVISEFSDPGVSGKYSIFAGDIISKINTHVVDNLDDYNAALEEARDWFLVTIRRPKLKFTNVRLVKIKYEATESEENGVTTLGDENIQIRVLASTLPFADEIEKNRKARDIYQPSDAEIAALKKGWYELPVPEMTTFVNGEHRIVAESDYDQSLRRDDILRNTKFAIISKLRGNPLAGQMGENIGIYGVREISKDEISGSYVESTLASAPFPISIDFNGAFTLKRLADYSDKDVEVLNARAAGKADEEEDDNVETAPDIPQNIPAE